MNEEDFRLECLRLAASGRNYLRPSTPDSASEEDHRSIIVVAREYYDFVMGREPEAA